MKMITDTNRDVVIYSFETESILFKNTKSSFPDGESNPGLGGESAKS